MSTKLDFPKREKCCINVWLYILIYCNIPDFFISSSVLYAGIILFMKAQSFVLISDLQKCKVHYQEFKYCNELLCVLSFWYLRPILVSVDLMPLLSAMFSLKCVTNCKEVKIHVLNAENGIKECLFSRHFRLHLSAFCCYFCCKISN